MDLVFEKHLSVYEIPLPYPNQMYLGDQKQIEIKFDLFI